MILRKSGQSGKSGWNEFYNFLEKTATIAKKLLTDEAIITALSGDKTKEEKKKYYTCGNTMLGSVTKQKQQHPCLEDRTIKPAQCVTNLHININTNLE